MGWRRALRAAMLEDWTTAESWLERVVHADSNDLDAYHALARLYRKHGAVGRAIRMHQNLLLRAELGGQERVDGLFELARDFEDGGFTERAAATYEELLGHQPRHVESIERLVPLLEQMRDFDRALTLSRKLRRKKKDLAQRMEVDLLLAQARVLAEEGDHKGSRRAVKRCLRADKECAAAHALLGELETERGKSSRALEAWKRAVRLDSMLGPELYTKIAAGYAAGNKPRDFEAFLRGLLEDRPNDARARIALARALSSHGESRSAVEELSRAVELAPHDLSLRSELGRQLLATGQETEALKAYGELIELLERSEDREESLL